ncbi:hypothetical protein HPB48_025319 [Haemaphysalis longicornis]|uniref:Uncharacterized protein n=1 Tax=Haemaphysalis longicornis TaxID=44386 RepID=A0A9J6H956_HAELO|nr:hypothetical protein HPB48_025319 [Haemaphysalis longicornis]
MPRVPLKRREDRIEMSKRGYTQRNIALVTGRPQNTVNRNTQAYRDEGRVNDALHAPQAT